MMTVEVNKLINILFETLHNIIDLTSSLHNLGCSTNIFQFKVLPLSSTHLCPTFVCYNNPRGFVQTPLRHTPCTVV